MELKIIKNTSEVVVAQFVWEDEIDRVSHHCLIGNEEYINISKGQDVQTYVITKTDGGKISISRGSSTTLTSERLTKIIHWINKELLKFGISVNINSNSTKFKQIVCAGWNRDDYSIQGILDDNRQVFLRFGRIEDARKLSIMYGLSEEPVFSTSPNTGCDIYTFS